MLDKPRIAILKKREDTRFIWATDVAHDTELWSLLLRTYFDRQPRFLLHCIYMTVCHSVLLHFIGFCSLVSITLFHIFQCLLQSQCCTGSYLPCPWSPFPLQLLSNLPYPHFTTSLSRPRQTWWRPLSGGVSHLSPGRLRWALMITHAPCYVHAKPRPRSPARLQVSVLCQSLTIIPHTDSTDT
jgi:hypothetical protein